MKKIEEVEALCAKVVEQVSQTREALIDGEKLERVIKQLRTTEIEATQLKNKMKKFPLAGKMDKDADMKNLEQ